jgi:hypothetical protein
MNFAFSKPQQRWHDEAARFAAAEVEDSDAVERERRGEFWRDGYARCAGRLRGVKLGGFAVSSLVIGFGLVSLLRLLGT